MAKRTMSVLAGLAALLLALLVVAAGPAVAGGKDNKGKAGKSESAGYTEDNDTNDGGTPNNVSDDGDNAHPSGKDRSVENGGSGTQGKSQSDPDGDSNGGPDKANGSGGVDKADQDGNNGCGNDDDFEDDNNGNCGPKDKVKSESCPQSMGSTKSNGKAKGKGLTKGCDEEEVDSETDVEDEVEGDITEPCVDADEMVGDAKVCDEEDDVLGSHLENDSDVEDDVLGTTITNDEGDAAAPAAAERESNGSALPFTGAAILSILALAVGLVGSGFLFLRRDRT